MPLKNPLRIVITIGSPGAEEVLTVIGDDDMPQNWQLRTADYTAQNRDRVIADVTAGAWELTLPPNASYGHEVEVLIDGANALTLNPNGAKVNGALDNLPITSDRAKLSIVYKDGWIVGTGSTTGSGSTGGGSEPTPTPSNPYSVEAQAVIAAILATGCTLSDSQKTACDNRINASKASGAWAKRTGYYGFLGSSDDLAKLAAAYRINWKTPGTYDLTWEGSLESVFSAQGVQSNNFVFAKTGFNPAVAGIITNSSHSSFYCRTDNTGEIFDFGVRRNGNQWACHLKLSDGRIYYDAPQQSGGVQAAIPSTQGSLILSINNGAGLIVRNQVVLAETSTTPGSVAIFNGELYFMRCNSDDQYVWPSNRLYGSFGFGFGLSQSEALAENAAEQTYQAAIGR